MSESGKRKFEADESMADNSQIPVKETEEEESKPLTCTVRPCNVSKDDSTIVRNVDPSLDPSLYPLLVAQIVCIQTHTEWLPRTYYVKHADLPPAFQKHLPPPGNVFPVTLKNLHTFDGEFNVWWPADIEEEEQEVLAYSNLEKLKLDDTFSHPIKIGWMLQVIRP